MQRAHSMYSVASVLVVSRSCKLTWESLDKNHNKEASVGLVLLKMGLILTNVVNATGLYEFFISFPWSWFTAKTGRTERAHANLCNQLFYLFCVIGPPWKFFFSTMFMFTDLLSLPLPFLYCMWCRACGVYCRRVWKIIPVFFCGMLISKCLLVDLRRFGLSISLSDISTCNTNTHKSPPSP